MGTELEWKLSAPDPALLDAVLAWEGVVRLLAETPRHYHMQTTYYDSPDRALAPRRITLRRRLENQRSVVCVKAPLPGAADPHLHGEWELEADSPAEALPRLIALGAPALLGELERLVPVCGADFQRRAALLRFPDGSACELALDAGRLFSGDRSVPLCELELEQKEGSPAAALALRLALTERFGLSPQERSKYARAKELSLKK